MNASILSIGGFLSQFIGGIISDKYEESSGYMAKAYVCIYGSILGCPTIALCTLYNTNFYAAMAGLALEYLFAESWGAPNIAML